MGRSSLPDYLLPFLDYCEVEKGLPHGTQESYRYFAEKDIDSLRPQAAELGVLDSRDEAALCGSNGAKEQRSRPSRLLAGRWLVYAYTQRPKTRRNT